MHLSDRLVVVGGGLDKSRGSHAIGKIVVCEGSAYGRGEKVVLSVSLHCRVYVLCSGDRRHQSEHWHQSGSCDSNVESSAACLQQRHWVSLNPTDTGTAIASFRHGEAGAAI